MSNSLKQPCDLTYEQLAIACKNIGFDLNCGSCAEQFFTGARMHPCDPNCQTDINLDDAHKRWILTMSLTRVSLICKECSYTARRDLALEPGSRGVRETGSVEAYCINGHGLMVRKDGLRQENWATGLEWKDTKDRLAEREKEKKGRTNDTSK